MKKSKKPQIENLETLDMSETSKNFVRVFFFRAFDFGYWVKIEKL